LNRAALNLKCSCAGSYFLAPAWGFFNLDWRSFLDLRLGFVIVKVPLPCGSAE